MLRMGHALLGLTPRPTSNTNLFLLRSKPATVKVRAVPMMAPDRTCPHIVAYRCRSRTGEGIYQYGIIYRSRPQPRPAKAAPRPLRADDAADAALRQSPRRPL